MTIKQITKYAGAVCCIADHFLKRTTGRDLEDLTARACINAIKELGNAIRAGAVPLEADYLWSAYTVGREGVRLGTIEQIEKLGAWDALQARTEYRTVANDFRALNALRKIFWKNGGDIFKAAEILKIYCWRLMGIIDGKQKIDKPLKWALLQFPEDGPDPSYEEIREKIIQYHESQKNGSKCQGENLLKNGKPALNARAKNLESS